MRNIISTIFLTFFLVGCEIMTPLMIGGYAAYDYIRTDDFDNVEYSHVVNLNILSREPDCNPDNLKKLHYHADFLDTYTEYRHTKQVDEVYDELYQIVNGLTERSNISEVFCRLKMENINETTTKILETYAQR